MCRYSISKWLRKKEDKAIIVLGCSFAGIILGGVILAYVLDYVDLMTLIETIVALLIGALPSYLYLAKRKEQVLLSGLNSIFFIEEDDSKIDDILGLLIAGKWEKIKIDPIDEFFTRLLTLCRNGEVETRRRVCEALPALYRLDLGESENLVEVLRYDWDEERWKGDNRRRTIESLHHILRKNKRFVVKCLSVEQKDDIYILIAIVEVIAELFGINRKREAEKLFNRTLSQMKKNLFSDTEIDAIKEFWIFIKLTFTDTTAAISLFDKLKSTENGILKVALSRNIQRLCACFRRCPKEAICKGDPIKAIELMEFFLQPKNPKNVRRPIAKEQTLDCLLVLLKFARYKNEAKRIIRTLLSDNDDIIRLAAFDKISNIYDIDKEFSWEILEHIKVHENNKALVERAERFSKKINEII